MQQDMGVTFHPGIPTIPWEEEFPLEQRPSLLVPDHFMQETVDPDQVMDLLSKRVHHLNLFMIVVTQNLYASKGKRNVEMNRNYQYTILFNLENIYYFPSCSGGPISLLHVLLDIWKPGGSSQYEKVLNARGKI